MPLIGTQTWSLNQFITGELKIQFLNYFYSTRCIVSMVEMKNTRQSKDDPLVDYINHEGTLSFDSKDQLSKTLQLKFPFKGCIISSKEFDPELLKN